MSSSSTIFFAKSKHCPKRWSYDHVGFITDSGTLVQVSGHRRDDGIYEIQDLSEDPAFNKTGTLQKVDLGKTVIIPDDAPGNIQNCTMFVSNITGIPNENIIEIFKTGNIKKIVNNNMQKSSDHLNEGFLELYQQIRQSSPRLFFDAQKITTLIAKASSKGYSAEKTWPYLKRLEELLGRREGYKRPSERVIGLFLFAKLTRAEERKNALKFYRDVLEAGRARSEITDLIKEYVDQELASKLAPAKKGEDVDVETTSKMAKDISPDVLGLVKNIYDPMGGMPGADSATGVLSRFTNFLVSDVDEDPEPDSGILYTNWHGSKKASAIVNDGGPESKAKTRELMADFFSEPGAWCEVSGAPANIAITKLGIPTVENEAEVRALMPAIKDIVWHGEHPRGVPYGKGWYTRNIAGHEATKIIIGNPPKRGTLKEYIEEVAKASK